MTHVQLLRLKYPLNLTLTLLCGQVFRFKRIFIENQSLVVNDDRGIKLPTATRTILDKNKNIQSAHAEIVKQEVFEGSIDNHLYQLIQLGSHEIGYIPLTEDKSQKVDTNNDQIHEKRIIQFFNLDQDIDTIHDTLSKLCPFYATIYPYYAGLQIINQSKQIFECIIAFITSSNNNVKRITMLMEKITLKYGERLNRVDSLDPFYKFPSYEKLRIATEGELRDLGFGYRAKFIVDSMKTIESLGGIDAFIEECHMKKESKDLIEHLMILPGIGRKVASCIALYAFRRGDVVPIDVHVLKQFHFCLYYLHLPQYESNLLQKFHQAQINSKIPITDKQMLEIMNVFKNIFSMNAGYLQLYIYASLVGENKKLLPQDVYNKLIEMRIEMLNSSTTQGKPNKRRKISSKEDL